MAKKERTVKIGTGSVPLKFAEAASAAANLAYENGEMMEKVSPVTKRLLKFWFSEYECAQRTARAEPNFHEGQRQAILNAIYLHEVLGAKNPLEAYGAVDASLLEENDGAVARELGKSKYAYPKYLVKMATGTGKTWVMHALMVWQYLNARAEKSKARSGRWTKNFLFVAPGLIVYERLLDAFKGRRRGASDARDFATSDMKRAEALFVPPEFREAMFAFLQNAVMEKHEFGKKATGDGVVAVMNWHAFLGDDDMDGGGEGDADDDGKGILDALLPARPGVAAGNALESLDARYLRGGRLDFLKDLPDLMMVNDEAHHIHAGKKNKSDEEDAVKWQKGIDIIAENKGSRFFQLDFSATPYETSGNGKSEKTDYFAYIMVDYDLTAAIRSGKVKTIVIDKRKALNDQLATLDFNAKRDDNKKVVDLSDGQRTMLRAGLERLRYLEEEFAAFAQEKKPKMMVVCEDTTVTPFVEDFLIHEEGLAEDEILTVDSNKKGDVGEKEWAVLKEKLFNIDRRGKPRVIISVLMLREGFDVNNICVIVPLRASNAPILLEQTLGRGLRLMWRESDYEEIKREAREQLLVKKRRPGAVLDFLYIIEHIKFQDFYDKMIKDNLVGEGTTFDGKGTGVGDLAMAELKENFADYDICWPIVVRESEEVIADDAFDDVRFKPFTMYPLAQLKRIFAQKGEAFIGEEMTAKTRFGEYRVRDGVKFNVGTYNEYLQRIIEEVMWFFRRTGKRRDERKFTLQTNLSAIMGLLDRYVRLELFGQPFDPTEGANWKIFLCQNGVVTGHIIAQVGELVYKIESGAKTVPAIVEKRRFSEVDRFAVRKSSSLALEKTIYTLTGYPSNRGGLEKAFMEFADRDADVEMFVKIIESKHVFARIAYLRSDGLMSEYIPDFLVATRDKMYLVETKAKDQEKQENVQRKQVAATEWCRKINELPEADRMGRKWAYLLITDKDFYAFRNGGYTFNDMALQAELTEANAKGELDLQPKSGS